MKRFFAILLLSGVAFGASSTLVVQEAAACVNSMERFKKKPTLLLVERAGWDIEQHRYRKAVQDLSSHWEELVEDGELLAMGAKYQGEHLRAIHLTAVAVVRSEGKWKITTSGEKLRPSDRTANVEWATAVLQKLAERSDEGRAHYAEALALSEDSRATARTILEDLAAGGSLSESAGWELLAELRAANGDEKKAEVARVNAKKFAEDEASRTSPSPTARQKPVVMDW